jgi:hypothetical protein
VARILGRYGGLGQPSVSAFLLAETARVSVSSGKGRVAELRSLLRFLFVTGRTEHALAAAVPPVAGWHDTGLPRGAKPAEVATTSSPPAPPAAR